MTTAIFNTLSGDRLERVESWGMNRSALSYVYRPTTAEQIADVFTLAKSHGKTVAFRGTGCSYGDASMNSENIVLDMTRMNRIIDWDPETGLISVEPGVTIRQLWQYIIEDGWWPPVVSGTMFVTLGGAASMNIHGKNNFKAGPIGDHIREFEIITPAGETKTCTREQNQELFYSAIGGFGMFGAFTRITLQMKKVYSGQLKVEAFATKNFDDIIEAFRTRVDGADYLVGWIDCFAKGDQLGRGLVHQANYLPDGADLNPAQTLRVVNQELPDTLLGVFPKSAMWRLLQPFSNNLGMSAINLAKYVQGSTVGNDEVVLQSHAQFAFLLDYVPNWKFAYKPGGLIQFQSFVPYDDAKEVFTEQIRLSHKFGIIPYLGVFKRHKPDDFLMTHAVDGFSLALDYPVTAQNHKGLATLTEIMTRLVVDAGGRHYFAKDSMLRKDPVAKYLGPEAIKKFRELKSVADPDNIIQSNLSRRLFDGFQQSEKPLSSALKS
jgi:decaprenylphospho-beta-D-ribofuranose 2-oxidase